MPLGTSPWQRGPRSVRRPGLGWLLGLALLLGGGLLLWIPGLQQALALPDVLTAAATVPAFTEGTAEPTAGVPTVRLAGGLLLLLAAAACAWVLRRRQAGTGTRSTRRIEVLEVRSLGGRRSLILVRVQGRELLVASSEAGLARLSEWPELDELDELDESAIPTDGCFAGVLLHAKAASQGGAS